jgi:hypothetical protein
MNKKLALFVLLTLTTTAVYAEDISKYQDEARAVAMPFMKQLGAANKKAVSEGGPALAVGVCQDIAPQMAGEISRQTGWKLSRVSLKVRNPLLGTADAWEQKALLEFEARVAKGEKPESMEVAEIVQEPAGKSFRFIKAIAMQPGCVACHGTTEQISDPVKARLHEAYPHDQAIGYSAGQIRGAVSIKRPL